MYLEIRKETDKTKSKMCRSNCKVKKNQTQKENEEMRRERQGLKRFALKSAGNLKRFHWKRDLSANQSRTRGHDACHATTEQLIRGEKPQAPQLPKKKKNSHIPMIV